jgi:hypothetical protein
MATTDLGPRRRWRAIGITAVLPPFAAAFFALTQPWARARVVAVWGIARSIEATLLVAACLAVALAGGIYVAWSGRRMRLAGFVHLGIGVLLALVSWQAFAMVRDAGVRALGFIPIASVRPGPGLQAFGAAAAWMLLLGTTEILLAARSRKRGRVL